MARTVSGLAEELYDNSPVDLEEIGMGNPRTRVVARIPGYKPVERIEIPPEGGSFTGWCRTIKMVTGKCPDNLDRDGRLCDQCFCG